MLNSDEDQYLATHKEPVHAINWNTIPDEKKVEPLFKLAKSPLKSIKIVQKT